MAIVTTWETVKVEQIKPAPNIRKKVTIREVFTEDTSPVTITYGKSYSLTHDPKNSLESLNARFKEKINAARLKESDVLDEKIPFDTALEGFEDYLGA